jgi:hypothetical protein
MTSRDFVIWFKGFMDGAHHHNITPAQWDTLKDKIKEVNDDVIYYDYETPNGSALEAAIEQYNQWVSTDTNSVSNEPKKELLND